MKEEIDWKRELLESKKFNNQFSKNILENGAKNYMKKSIWDIFSIGGKRLEVRSSRPFKSHFPTILRPLKRRIWCNLKTYDLSFFYKSKVSTKKDIK